MHANRSKKKIKSINIIAIIQEAIYHLHQSDIFEIIKIIEEIAHLNDTYLDLYYGDDE